MRDLLSKAAKYRAEARRRKLWQRVVSLLVCVVLLFTTYAQILPAITLEQTARLLDCHYAVHEHTAACYDGDELICGQADFVVHTHDKNCYDPSGRLVCPLPEIKTHTHTEACYASLPAESEQEQTPADGAARLICGQKEAEGHTHTDECYETEQVLVCGLEATEGHTHTDACYEKQLTCTETETEGHTHDEDCYKTTKTLLCINTDTDHIHSEACYDIEQTLICTEDEVPAHEHDDTCYEEVLICGQEEAAAHEHTEACYEERRTLICEKEETEGHTHSEECYAAADEEQLEPEETPAPSAEDEAQERELICGQEEIVLHTHSKRCYDETGALICGQLEVLEHQHQDGCFQSAGEGGSETPDQPEEEETPASRLLEAVKGELGYTEDEDGHTLYGEHYARGDEPWNVMFVAYCLEKAEITAMPSAEDVLFDCDLWRAALQAQELYQSALTYTPAPGELVFLDEDGDNIADLVAVVEKVTDERVEVIAGDLSDGVRRADYSLDEDSILGYAQLPEDEEKPVEDDDPKQEEGPKDDTGEETPDKDEPADDEKEEEDAPAQGLAGRVLAAAVGQIGYAAAEDGTTLYGEFYDRADAPWNVMFAAYCLEQAGVAELPLAAAADFACDDWLAALTGAELFREGGAYTPAPGDLAFFDLDEDGAADFVAIVEKIAANRLHLIAGDVAAGCVKRSSWALDDAKLVGYVQLAEQADEQETPAEETKLYQTAEDSPVQATVTFAKESKISKDAVLTVSPITETLLLADPEEDGGKASYALLKEQAEQAVGKQAVGKQAAQFALYDISFYTPDEEYIPVTESATVSLRLEGDAFKAAEQIAVLHYPAGQEEPTVLENVVWETDEDGITTVTFQTDGFSVFGIMALAEDELTAQGGNNSFTLTYSVGETNYTITFNVVDAEGNPIPGEYTRNNIIAANETRYIFASKDENATENGKFVQNIAPTISGYTYNGATNVTNGGDKTWHKGQIYSVATNGYKDGFGWGQNANASVNGCRFYTSEPIVAKEILSWGAGNYTITLTYTKDADNFEGDSFAIVDNSSKYALTVDEADSLTAVNILTTLDNAGTKQIVGSATEWQFKRQADGTHLIYTIIGGQQKYLCLSDDSLALTESSDSAAKFTIEWKQPQQQLVSIKTADRYLGIGGTAQFELVEDETQNYFCKVIEALHDYDGNWVIVNRKGAGVAGVAMQSSSVIESNSSAKQDQNNRSGIAITIREEETAGSTEPVAYSNDAITKWTFEKNSNGTYYIRVMETYNYIQIGGSGSAVTLGTKPQEIIITEGTGTFAGKVRLTNTDGVAINLFGGTAERGFGSYKGVNMADANEWQALIEEVRPYSPVTTTVNHPSSVINLFDYWITAKGDPDNILSDLDEGVNKGHTLKFVNKIKEVLADYNTWTGNSSVRSGIVQSLLGEDGYPVLNIPGNESESLNYLFNPSVEQSYKESHRNVNGLLQVDSEGYYYYNSQENFAEYSEDQNEFKLYDTWGVLAGGTSPNGQFFPFNSMDEVMSVKSTDSKINHYLGLTLTTRFIQRYDGYTTSEKRSKTVFKFTGDDDVWIFIDGVLVADLGGIHDAASVSIDFSTGDVTINNVSQRKLLEIFTNADKAGSTQWNGNTFADNTYHTLKFFYLERGNTDSNLELQYNLSEIPVTAIYKVNQYDAPVPGAEFAVYRADSSYKQLSQAPAYTGFTDVNGEMVFQDSDNMPYSLDELRDMFGDYFILKETKAPENYSIVSNEIHLYIQNGVLLCDNTYESGVWAAPTLQVAAPHDLKVIEKDGTVGRRQYYDLDTDDVKGTLFAVVLKYKGTGSLNDEENWAPVYGNDKNGYTIVDGTGNFIGAAIDAAQKAGNYGADPCFSLSASGAMQLEIKDIPGDITTYYYMLEDDAKDNTQYTIGYYWTEDTLENATSDNTFRVDADDETNTFDRVFGATIQVPNLLNRLFVQKLNEEGELVNGATFALYEVVEEGPGDIYYKASGAAQTLIKLYADTDGDNKGVAKIKETAEDLSYIVDGKTGVISVGEYTGETGEIWEGKYTIVPYENKVETTAPANKNSSGEDGTATFSTIDNGTYYIREIDVPTGYLLNSTEVMVLVANDAVYANAGTADDGVSVARGPGYLVSTLRMLASQGDIDNTLSWIYAKMRISGESNTFHAYDKSEGAPGPWEEWRYLKENNSCETVADSGGAHTVYLKYDAGGENTLFNYTINEGRYGTEPDITSIRRRIYTTVGWPYYEIYQDRDYGWKNKGNANYTDLKTQEIANLFSRSTYIQVTDRKIDGTLTISKKVVGTPSNANEDYRFTVELYDAEDNLLNKTYQYSIYQYEEKQDGTRQAIKTDSPVATGTWQPDDKEIVLKNGQIAVIENLPAGTRYAIKEAEPANGDYMTSAVRDKNKQGIGGSSKAGEASFAREVEGTLYWRVWEDEEKQVQIDTTSTVDYTNTYLTGLTIHKVDQSERFSLKDAKFVLYKIDEGGNREYYKYDDTQNKVTWNELEDGQTTDAYILTSDQEGLIPLHIEDGSHYYLEEVEAPQGYYELTEAIHFAVADGKLVEVEGASNPEGVKLNGLILTVPNHTSYELPQTGGPGWIRWYMPLAGLILLAAGIYSILRRRKEAQ